MPTHRHPARWTSTRKVRRARQRWRSTRRPGEAGPEAWARARELVGALRTGPGGTSTPPYRAAGHREGRSQEATPAFVELFPALPTVGPALPCTIELSAPSGRRLTLSLQGAPGPVLVAVAQALWSELR